MAFVAAVSLSGCLLMERADLHISLKSPTLITVTMSGIAVNTVMLERKAAGKRVDEVARLAETRDLFSMMAGKDAIRRIAHIDGARFAVETSGDMTSKLGRFTIFEIVKSKYGTGSSGTFWVVSVSKVGSNTFKEYDKFDVRLNGRLCATPLPEMVLVSNSPISPEKIRLDGVDAWCLPLNQNNLATDQYLAFYYPGETKISSPQSQ